MIRALAGFLGAAAGIDPVMRKEFYGLSRRWQTYAGRTAYVGILALAVWILWDSFARERYSSYSMYAELGYIFFAGFSGIQFALIGLSAIGSGSDLIAREVRGKTLGILAITPLSPWRIVAGKWKSAMGFTAITLLGGAGGGQLLAVASLTLSMAAAGAALAILFSSFARTAFLGAVASALVILGSMLVPWAVSSLLSVRYRGDEFLEAACWVHPIYSLAMTISRAGPLRGTSLPEYSWITASAASLAGAFAALWLASLRVRKLVRMEPRPPLLKRAFEKLDRIFEASPLGIKLWTERKGVWDRHPFLWKEMHSRIGGKFRYFTRIALGLYLVLAVVMALGAGDFTRSSFLLPAYALLMVLFYLGCVGAGSGAFTAEKEEKKWDLLLAAPIRPAPVVWAKFAGAWLSMALFAVTAVLLAILSAYSRSAPAVTLLPVVLTTLAFANFVVCMGLFFSILTETTRKARGLTLGVAFFLLVGIPMIMAILAMGSRSSFSGEAFEAFVKTTNPFYFLELLEGGYYGYGYDYNYGRLDTLGVYAVMQVVLYGTGALFMIMFTMKRLRRLAGRQTAA